MSPLGASGLLSTTSPTAANDRGVVHQLLVDAGVSSNVAHTVQVWTIGPIKVVIILGVAFILTRMQPRLARRVATAFRLASPANPATPRASARARTIAGVLSAIFRTVIWIVALLTIFSELGLHLTAFVATATVVGAALGFGAQTLVKDFLSGLLILAEDQYGVGDNVVVGATTGTVEGVTLRVTRIRSMDGVVWYVPNGDIRTVGNNSDGDNQALVEVVVPMGTDLMAACRVVEDEAHAMTADAVWAPLIVGGPTFVGVAEVTADGATLRVMAHTAPGVDVRVAQELRLRILEALRRSGVAWAPEAVDGKGGGAAAGDLPGLGSQHEQPGQRTGDGEQHPAPTATTGVAVVSPSDPQAMRPPAPHTAPETGNARPTARSSLEPPRRLRLPRWLRRRFPTAGDDPETPQP